MGSSSHCICRDWLLGATFICTGFGTLSGNNGCFGQMVIRRRDTNARASQCIPSNGGGAQLTTFHAARFHSVMPLIGLLGCTPTGQPESTARMVELLEAIAADTDENPRRNAHANVARVRSLLEAEPPATGAARVQYEHLVAQEMLRAGESEGAIARYSALRDTIEGRPDLYGADYKLGVLDHLALSYLRLGEQQNCLLTPGAKRCVLPVGEGGVHALQEGSRNAIAVHEQILAEDPVDLNAIRLLNLAHMTVGQYPDSVDLTFRVPPEVFVPEYDIGTFEDIAPSLGLDVMGLSGGVVMEDLNQDGYLDLMTSSWGLRDTLRYFENLRNGLFAEQTADAGLVGLNGGLNLTHADYDNDGLQDILVLRGAWLQDGHPNSLLRNLGEGGFQDVTDAAGLLSFHPTQTASWGDYDNDGDLDLFIGNESTPAGGVHPCELYRNNGDGTIEEVAAEAGLRVVGYVKSVVWGDYTNDGWLDLFVSRYRETNLLFRNLGSEGTFEETAAQAGVLEPADSFPSWFIAYDNDGWLDLFVSGWRATAGDVAAEYLGLSGNDEKPRLYRNNGDGTFEDMSKVFGLDRVMYTMGSNFGDLDNDGWLDFYVGTGDPNLRSLMPNRMLRNHYGQRFQEVTSSGGFGLLQKGHGVAFGDLNHDGDQDIYTVMGGAFEGDIFGNVLFANPGHGNDWVTLRLEGVRSNRSAIGARIMVTVESDLGERRIHRVVGTGGSFGSSSLRQEIGLGQAHRITSVAVRWPTKDHIQVFRNVPINSSVYLEEGAQHVKVETATPIVLGSGGHH